MNPTLRNIAHLGLILGVLASVSCSNSGQMTVSDSNSYLAETAVGSINAALTHDEKSTVTGCSNSQNLPAAGSTTCSGTVGNETVTSIFNCSIGRGVDQLLKGTITLTFDEAATCTDWLNASQTTGSVTWTSDKLLRTTSDSAGIVTSSTAAKNYKGVSIGGGIKSAWSETTGATTMLQTSLNITGLHVVRLATGNLTVYDHTVTTTGALDVTGSLSAGTRTISSGTIVIDHNLQDFTATGTIANLKWGTPSCCLPTSGTINFAMSGSAKGSIAIDFSTGTCGKISISDASVVATTAAPSPSPIPSGLASNYTAVIGGCE